MLEQAWAAELRAETRALIKTWPNTHMLATVLERIDMAITVLETCSAQLPPDIARIMPVASALTQAWRTGRHIDTYVDELRRVLTG